MKLLKLKDGVWVNPEHITSIYVDMRKIRDSPDYEYPVMVHVGEKHFCVDILDVRSDAEGVANGFVDKIMEALEE